MLARMRFLSMREKLRTTAQPREKGNGTPKGK